MEYVKNAIFGSNTRIYSLGKRLRKKQLIRFHSKYVKSNGCWEWIGTRTDNGHKGFYGVIGINKKQLYAHRVMWQLANGKTPKNLEVCHKCDNPPCVNPDHLFLATHKDNLLDAKSKGRMASGKNHGVHTHPPLRIKGRFCARTVKST